MNFPKRIFIVSLGFIALNFPLRGLSLQQSLPNITQNRPIKNFHKLNDTLYRSGKLTDRAQVYALKNLGIRSVLSLESYMLDPSLLDQERSWVEDIGLEFFHLPMSPLPSDIPDLQDIYRALDILTRAENQPILVHCHNGSDRVGVVIASYHVKYDGWTPERAILDMQRFGHSPVYYHWDYLIYLIE